MNKERQKERIESVVDEVEVFLRDNYPVRRKDVNAVLDDLHSESERGSVGTSINRSISITMEFARQSGIERKPKGSADVLHIPARLAAIRKFEKENPDELYQLPLSRYLVILALGEAASLQIGTGGGWRFQKEVDVHMDRLEGLIYLHRKLKKTDPRL